MKILIVSEPDDNHAVIVQLALEDAGHEVRILFTADLPTKQKYSVYVNSEYHWKIVDQETTIMDQEYDVVWWRRPRKPYIPKNKTHPDDYRFISRENEFLHESLVNTIAPDAWWINRKAKALCANSKMFQLKTALECGLMIPTTLCSNDPREIRYFLLAHGSQGVIYKPLCVGFWFEEESIKLTYTSKIDFLSLPRNQTLQMTPGIFQKEIKKAFELRIVCFGEYIVAAKLNSQAHLEGQTDWRAIPAGQMIVEPYQLPIAIEEKICLLMRKMGLVFGSLDFIVTENGEYVFLEVNEQGQFLWLEAYHKDIKMLEPFIYFIENRSEHFKFNSQSKYSVDVYTQKAVSIVQENVTRHVNLNSANSPWVR